MTLKSRDILSFIYRKIKRQKNFIRYFNVDKIVPDAYGNKKMLTAYQKSRITGPEPCVCHAPTRSIYIDMHGNVTPCCFNRIYIYGQYPQNSIEEIIKGEKRKFLQKELCRSNFMYGCQHCHKLIENGNFEGTEARLYDTLKSNKDYPSEIIFELDNTCNLECIMCNESFSSKIAAKKNIKISKINFDDIFLDQLSVLIPYLKVAKFLGGEPFLINIYYKIWDLIINLNPKCKINLQTNGTIYNEKIKSYLEKGNFYIGMSIDSLDKVKFESIRLGADYETVMQNFENFLLLSKKKGNYLNISVCPMQQNIYEIPEIVNFCNEKGAFIYFNTVYTSDFSLYELNEYELKKIINYFKKSEIKTKNYISKRNKLFFDNLLQSIENLYKAKEEASRPNRKRHLWTFQKLLNEIQNKVPNIDLLLDNNIIKNLPSEFYLSDKDIENLKNLNPEDIIKALKTETSDNIEQRIINFIETGNFSL